jgi:excisionase family DNA binding protein
MLRVKQLAKLVNLSASKIYQMVERGEIQHRRIGATILFAPEDVEDLMEQSKKSKQERGEPRPCRSKPPRPRLRHVKL